MLMKWHSMGESNPSLTGRKPGVLPIDESSVGDPTGIRIPIPNPEKVVS
jgi:hypothetical protein